MYGERKRRKGKCKEIVELKPYALHTNGTQLRGCYLSGMGEHQIIIIHVRSPHMKALAYCIVLLR